MPIRLRLALHGHRHRKVFHLVAINSGLRREAKPAELLGVYDPHKTEDDDSRVIRWSVSRIRYWLNVGAIPSKSALKMLELGGIVKPGSPFHRTKTRPLYPLPDPSLSESPSLSETTLKKP